MLFNFDIDSRDRAVVLFVGLRQRITMNYNLESLSKEEALEYLKGKLSGAKCTMEVFNPNALESIANASNGIAMFNKDFVIYCFPPVLRI